MKTLIASALIASAAIAGTAQAMTSPTVNSEARFIVPGADFSGLTAAQVNTVNSIVHGGDTTSEKRAALRAFLK